MLEHKKSSFGQYMTEQLEMIDLCESIKPTAIPYGSDSDGKIAPYNKKLLLTNDCYHTFFKSEKTGMFYVVGVTRNLDDTLRIAFGSSIRFQNELYGYSFSAQGAQHAMTVFGNVMWLVDRIIRQKFHDKEKFHTVVFQGAPSNPRLETFYVSLMRSSVFINELRKIDLEPIEVSMSKIALKRLK